MPVQITFPTLIGGYRQASRFVTFTFLQTIVKMIVSTKARLWYDIILK